jgi:hypothetical protein
MRLVLAGRIAAHGPAAGPERGVRAAFGTPITLVPAFLTLVESSVQLDREYFAWNFTQ